MTHYIFLNGPPRSGRTTIASMIFRAIAYRSRDPRVVFQSLSFPLKDFFVAALAQPWGQLNDRTPRAVLNGMSGLDAYLKLRLHVRAVYGPSTLARWLEHRVLGLPEKPKVVIVDDLLFQDDYDFFSHHPRTLIHTGKSMSGFVWLHPADLPKIVVMEREDYLKREQVETIVGSIDV